MGAFINSVDFLMRIPELKHQSYFQNKVSEMRLAKNFCEEVVASFNIFKSALTFRLSILKVFSQPIFSQCSVFIADGNIRRTTIFWYI